MAGRRAETLPCSVEPWQWHPHSLAAHRRPPGEAVALGTIQTQVSSACHSDRNRLAGAQDRPSAPRPDGRAMPPEPLRLAADADLAHPHTHPELRRKLAYERSESVAPFRSE